ncbi:unnamed protein product [Diplocarpon coronariae]|nr:hypothetical protein JHW43_007856 [Diplocarpon mali]
MPCPAAQLAGFVAAHRPSRPPRLGATMVGMGLDAAEDERGLADGRWRVSVVLQVKAG